MMWKLFPEIGLAWSAGPWMWRSCVGTHDGHSSPVYRAIARPHCMYYDVEEPGPVSPSTCADLPREMKGGGGIYIAGKPELCGLADAFQPQPEKS